jgi:trehalose 6-phosphate phosphatase
VETVRRELPQVLESLDLGDAEIEDKGLSVAVHVRRLDDPATAFGRLAAPLADLAEAAGLIAEPGRKVVELRPPGMDKGLALRDLVREIRATAVMFVGDDLGDRTAFAEVRRLRAQGVAGLLVCSASAEVTELAAEADVVVDGPSGVTALVEALVEALGGVHA